MGVLIVIGLAAVAVTGLRLWRSVRAARRVVGESAAELSAEGERLQAAIAAMPERQGELQAALSGLSARVAVVSVLAQHASDAMQTLLAPLRLGR